MSLFPFLLAHINYTVYIFDGKEKVHTLFLERATLAPCATGLELVLMQLSATT